MVKFFSIGGNFPGAVFLIIWWTLVTVGNVDAQHRLSKKERKLQDREAKADRMFVEGQRFLMLEEYDKAYFYFGKALEYKPDAGAINFKIAEILSRAKQYDEALKYGQKAIDADPENKYYHLLKAEIYSRQKKPKLAAEVLNSLMEASGDGREFILELASMYISSQEYDKALETLDKAEEYYGVVAQLSLQKQKIYLQKNDLEKAVAEGERLIEAHPGYSEYVLALVEVLFNNGKTDSALDLVLQNLEAYPDQSDLQLAAYSLYASKNDQPTALSYLFEAFSDPDLSATVKAGAYRDILREMKTPERDSLLNRLGRMMEELHPEQEAVYAVLGDKELLLKNKDAALAHYRRSLQIQPADEGVLQSTISLMFELGTAFSEIEEMTETAVEEFPEKAEFWFYDGTSKLAQKKYEKAEKSFLNALEFNKGVNRKLDILVGSQLGDTYHSLNKKEAAYETYEKFLALNPDNAHILNNYAYFLSLDKINLDKAKSMSEKLVRKFPDNSTYLDTHAWVLFQLKDYKNALLFMKQALENQTEPSGVMYEHYGDILYKLGEKKEALNYWKKAESLDQASELLDKKIKNKQYYEE